MALSHALCLISTAKYFTLHTLVKRLCLSSNYTTSCTNLQAHGAQAVRRVASNDIRMDVLMAIPSVGREIAERLLDKCGSIEEMAFPESLKQVKGLGEARRKLLMKVLTSEEEVRQERKVRR